MLLLKDAHLPRCTLEDDGIVGVPDIETGGFSGSHVELVRILLISDLVGETVERVTSWMQNAVALHNGIRVARIVALRHAIRLDCRATWSGGDRPLEKETINDEATVWLGLARNATQAVF